MINFLITRPLSSAHSLRDKIAQRTQNKDINMILFPVIEIRKLNFSPKLDSKLLELRINISQIDMMIFVSPAAVEHSLRYIQTLFISHQIQIENTIKLFTIGKDTAEKIENSGFAWHKVIYPSEKFNSEALLALEELNAINITNKNIIIFKGAGGNPVLTETLRTRGANVIEAVVYARHLPKPNKLPDLNNIDLILCTSSESMNNLISLLGEAVKEKRLLVSSERLILLAKTLGFKPTPLLAQNAGDEALIAALKQESKTEM